LAQIQPVQVVPAVPDNILEKIQKELPVHILNYKQDTNPEMKKSDLQWAAQGFFLPDTLSSNSYQLIFESIDTFVEVEGQIVFKNLYLVKKKGHRFTNFEKVYNRKTYDGRANPWQDTISLDLYSKYYPADEQYLVYCDSAQLYLVGGNVFWGEFRWLKNHVPIGHHSSMVFYRTVQFHAKGLKRDTDWADYSALEKDTVTYIMRRHATNQGHGYIIKMPKKPPYHMTMTYYTNKKETTGGDGRVYWEITQTRPEGIFQGYEPIRPRIREITGKEFFDLVKTPKNNAVEFIMYDE
jgi:hypothetical protein